MKKLGSWFLRIVVAVLSPALGCGRRNAPVDPPQSGEIHWQAVETGYSATTATGPDGKSKPPDRR